jgi:HlyD family secretion protein
LAGVAKARANYANAKSVSARRQMLLGNSSTSVEQAEAAKTAEATALADMDLAAAEGAVARAAISDAVAQGQQETATLDFHTLMSPYDAMVVARQKELGSALAAVEPVFTLIDPQTVWVLAYVDESKAGEINAGQPAEILLRSRPYERFGGQVARIEPESDRVSEERRSPAFDQIPANFNSGRRRGLHHNRPFDEAVAGSGGSHQIRQTEGRCGRSRTIACSSTW